MIQSGYTPRKEWIERHFRVELEEKDTSEEQSNETTYDPQEDQNLFESVMSGEEGATAEQPGGATPEDTQAAAADLQAAADETALPAGAAPEESQADAIEQPPAAEQAVGADMTDSDIDALIAMMDQPEEEEPTKPFGNQKITEDEAVEMDK
jgi:flagellar biosynthesis/type III secretory pathway M-ring protein FliF/YscJ